MKQVLHTCIDLGANLLIKIFGIYGPIHFLYKRVYKGIRMVIVLHIITDIYIYMRNNGCSIIKTAVSGDIDE